METHMTSEKGVKKVLRDLFKKLNATQIIATNSDKSRATMKWSCNLTCEEYENIKRICNEPEK